MRRRNRKHRKPVHQETDNKSVVTKGNNQDNIICSRGSVNPYFTTKISEPIPSCQFNLIIKDKNAKRERRNNKDNKKQKKKYKNKKAPIADWYENNFFMSFPSSKTSSVAFFIPLKECIRDFNDNEDFKSFMDWNSLLFYQSNSSSMISNYNLKRKSSTPEKSMVSEFRKDRSSSESSINSEDSFICFEISDDYSQENDDDIHFIKETDVGDYSPCTSDSSPNSSGEKSKNRKRVHFADNSELVKVHVIIAWDFAYRAARVSPWEVAARDANRFKSKIQSLEPIISPILNKEHRSKVWQTRMQKYYN